MPKIKRKPRPPHDPSMVLSFDHDVMIVTRQVDRKQIEEFLSSRFGTKHLDWRLPPPRYGIKDIQGNMIGGAEWRVRFHDKAQAILFKLSWRAP